ncbi:hypothetical protein [Ferrovum sp.]|uniref:hypothetical protein n=1 Tax=Ferrovum sp. TaxID=2609467 RepID=UPI002606ACB2|nr:hypothetical protein [Ferrovum sp.]
MNFFLSLLFAFFITMFAGLMLAHMGPSILPLDSWRGILDISIFLIVLCTSYGLWLWKQKNGRQNSLFSQQINYIGVTITAILGGLLVTAFVSPLVGVIMGGLIFLCFRRERGYRRIIHRGPL